MIDPQTIIALSQEIIDALGLDESAKASITEELSTCSLERLMDMTKALESYHKGVALTANQISGQVIRDGNEAREQEERNEFDTNLSLF
jgi:hypothetical protein